MKAMKFLWSVILAPIFFCNYGRVTVKHQLSCIILMTVKILKTAQKIMDLSNSLSLLLRNWAVIRAADIDAGSITCDWEEKCTLLGVTLHRIKCNNIATNCIAATITF
jgi:hypothetical protein